MTRLKNNGGFTLIEMVVVLVLLAIMGAIAGMAIINVTNGLLLTKQNAATALKTQVALSRLDKECHIITVISAASTPTALSFTNDRGGSVTSFTLSQNGTYIDLATGGNPADHLIDNVVNNSLLFSYLQSDGITAATPPDTAKVVKISFKLTGAEGVQVPFTMSIAPRPLLNEPA